MRPFLAVALALLFVLGCAGLDTPEKKALSIRVGFNQMLEEYVSIRKDLPISEETIKKADALFRAAAKSLNLYESRLDAGDSTELELAEFLKTKNEIIKSIGGVMGWD